MPPLSNPNQGLTLSFMRTPTYYLYMPHTVLVGIVNCTPDSFSDGIGSSVIQSDTPALFIDRALALLDAGANMLDVGGDSTRPGSHCTDDEEEWRRIEPILKQFCHKVPVSVDTHKAEIARRSIDLGAAMINDVSGGRDIVMTEVVARSNVLYTYMFNAFNEPHNFSAPLVRPSADTVISTISLWAEERARILETRGIPLERQVMDPGMGGFVSPNPAVSYTILRRYWEISSPTQRRLLGCSRKGFLKKAHEGSILERDSLSAALGRTIRDSSPADMTLYIRVHNIGLQRELLRSERSLS